MTFNLSLRLLARGIAGGLLVSACISAPGKTESDTELGAFQAHLAVCRDASDARLELIDHGRKDAQIVTGTLRVGNQDVSFSADFDLAASEDDDEGLVFEGIAGVAETKGGVAKPERMSALAFDRLSRSGEGVVTLQYGRQYVEVSGCSFNEDALARLRGQEDKF